MPTLSHILMLVAMLMMLVFPRGLAAQGDRDVTVQAGVSAEQAYVGDQLLYRITINGSNQVAEPTAPSVPGCDLRFIGGSDSSQYMRIIINGRDQSQTTRAYALNYQLTPTRAGTLTIPSITVMVDGTPFKTKPVTLSVLEPKEAAGFALVIVPEKDIAYVGEPIKVKFIWTLGASISRDFLVDLPESSALELFSPATSIVPGRQLPENIIQFPFGSSTAVGTIANAEENGVRRTTITFEQILVPKTAGMLSIGPAKVVCNVAVGQRRASMADWPNTNRTTYERQTVTSEPVEIKVNALPTPAPAGFTGLVGNYSVDVAATPTVAKVGDPITLSVRIGGPEPLDRVPPLDLQRQPGFANAREFKLPSDQPLPTILSTAAIYSVTVRPLSDSVSEIPAIELPYFDVKTGEYAVAKSKPVPLMIEPTKEITLDDEPGAVAAGASDASDAAAQAALPRIVSEPSFLSGKPVTIGDHVRTPVGLAVMALPVAAYLGACVFGMRRAAIERDPAGRRRRRAARRAASRLRRARREMHPIPAVSAALRGYAADAQGAPEPGVTNNEFVRFIEREHPRLVDDARALMRRLDAAEFSGAGGGGAIEPKELVDEAGRFLDVLRRGEGRA